MAKLWSLALALLVGVGVWAGPALAEPVTESKLGESGLQFNSDNFSLSMKSRVQFRMTYQNEVANGENGVARGKCERSEHAAPGSQ
jgi:hypothetical protein